MLLLSFLLLWFLIQIAIRILCWIWHLLRFLVATFPSRWNDWLSYVRFLQQSIHTWLLRDPLFVTLFFISDQWHHPAMTPGDHARMLFCLMRMMLVTSCILVPLKLLGCPVQWSQALAQAWCWRPLMRLMNACAYQVQLQREEAPNQR